MSGQKEIITEKPQIFYTQAKATQQGMAMHTHKNNYSFPTTGGSDTYAKQNANNPDQKLIWWTKSVAPLTSYF